MSQKHHYISQFYLRNFSPNGHSGKVWVYEKPKEKPSLKSIRKHVAVISDYYAIELDNGKKSYILEQEIEKIEMEVGRIAKRIKDENYILSDEEKYYILYFGAITFLKIPAFKNSIEKFKKQVLQGIADTLGSNENVLKSTLNKIPNLKIDKSEIDIKKLSEHFKDLKEDEIEISKNYFLGHFIKQVPNLLNLLLNMKWALHFIKGKEVYITSDRPIFPYKKDYNFPFGPGFAIADYVFFPLTKKICLVGLWGDQPTNLITDRYMVNAINYLVMQNCYKFIYSPINYNGLDKRFNTGL